MLNPHARPMRAHAVVEEEGEGAAQGGGGLEDVMEPSGGQTGLFIKPLFNVKRRL